MSSFVMAVVAAICALSLTVSTARADVTLGNLGSTGGGSLDIVSVGLANAGDDLALGFTTGNDPAFLQLTDVTIGLSVATAGNVAVTLHADSSSAPGSALAWTNTQSVGTTASKISFTAPQFTLSPNTPYWFVVDAASGMNWWRADPNVAPTDQNSSGWNWNTSLLNPNGAGWGGLGDANSLSISAVPEPAPMLALTAAAAALTGGFLRHRTRKASSKA